MKNQGKGVRLSGNKVIAQESNTGQIRITVPRAIADMILLQDKDIVSYTVTGRDKVTITKEKMTLEEYKLLKTKQKILKNRLGEK